MLPDQETAERIDYLAQVGHAIDETSNANNHQTNFYLAKDALDKFAEGLNKLTLKPESRDGMDKLIKYLYNKIDKRLKASLTVEGVE
jgi:hypothetical protein